MQSFWTSRTSIAPAQKENARAALAGAVPIVSRHGADVLVRLNRPWRMLVRDVEAAVLPGVAGLMLTKVDSAEHVQSVAEVVEELEAERGLRPGVMRFVVLIETTAAFFRMEAIARAHPRVAGISLGTEDFTLSAGMVPEPEGLLYPKQHTVFAARAAGIQPLGFVGSIADYRDQEAFRAIVRRSRKLGFVGASCIHPLQVPVLNEEFAPAPEEVDKAERMVAAYDAALAAGTGAVAFEGKMIDVPVVERARAVLARAERDPPSHVERRVMPALFLSAVGPHLTAHDFDLESGALTQAASTTLPANVQYAWRHPHQPILYVASSDGVGGRTHRLSALRLDAGLALHGEPAILPARPIHICVDGAGRHVLAAFNDPAGLRVWRIEGDGRLGRERPQGGLDAGIFPHQVRLTADDALAIVAARGNDAMAGRPEDPGALKVFRYDDGVLTPLASVAPEGGLGFGPRHLDFHPTKPWIYVSLERQNRLEMFERAGQGIDPAARFSRTTLAEPGRIWPRQLGGTVHVHPSGRFVYVANRADARGCGWCVRRRGQYHRGVRARRRERRADADPACRIQGFHCRTFSIDPAGRLMIAAHIAPMRVREGGALRTVAAGMSSFRIEQDGRLRFLCRTPVETHGRSSVLERHGRPECLIPRGTAPSCCCAVCSTRGDRWTTALPGCPRWSGGIAPRRIGSPPPCSAAWGRWMRCSSRFCARRRRPRCAMYLRLGAAGLLLLDTPAHAAVGTAVALVERQGLRGFAGLVNAVLRRVGAAGRAALEALDGPRLDTPAWLWASWGADARAIATAHQQPAPLDITLRSHPAGEGGVRLPTGSVRFPAGTDPAALPGFAEGAFWVQDAAAALPARLLNAQPGERVADLCAAPGGKTAQLAAAGALVTAVDRDPARLARLRENLDRLGLTAQTIAADASAWVAPEPFDAVLLDAPCTATGTIRRHPDLPHLKRQRDVAAACAAQDRLLAAALGMLRPGGRLIYAVCSLQQEEGMAPNRSLYKQWLGTCSLHSRMRNCGRFRRLAAPAARCAPIPGCGRSSGAWTDFLPHGSFEIECDWTSSRERGVKGACSPACVVCCWCVSPRPPLRWPARPVPSSPPGLLRLPHAQAAVAQGHELLIVAVGSSSTEGAMASSPSHSYPAQLQAMLASDLPQGHVAVINRGIGGQDAGTRIGPADGGCDRDPAAARDLAGGSQRRPAGRERAAFP